MLCILGMTAFIAGPARALIVTAGTTTIIDPTTIGSGANGVTIDPAGTGAYVTLSGTDKYVFIDKATGAVRSVTLSTCSGPMGIVFSSDGQKGYAACYNSNSVVEFDPASPLVNPTTIPVGTAPFFLAMSPDGTKIYVTNSGGTTGTVSVVSTATDTVTATIPVGLAPVAVAFNPSGTKAYVAAGTNVAGGNVVTMINVATSTVPAGTPSLPNPISVTGVPYGLAVSNDGASLWVSRDNGLKVSIINTSNNTVGTTFTTTGKPEGVTISPDGKRVYVPMQTGGIAVFDAINKVQLPNLAAGVGTRHMAFSADGTFAYATNYDDNSVSEYAFDSALPTITGTAPAGVLSTPYTFTPTVTGTNATVSLLSGTLPPGLTLSGGVISGTPTASGVFTATLQASNDNGTAQLAISINIPASYSVTFDPAGGVPIPTVQTITSGDPVAQPSDPTLDGYTFDGWWDGASPWDFATDTVTGPLTLTAHWLPIYAVTFDAAGGTPVPSTQDVTSGDLATAPADPTRAGYIFNGWWDGGTQWDFAADPVTGALTLTAEWLALPTISDSTSADAPLGTPFSWTPTITAAAGYSVTSTTLPDGLSLDAATGTISGTPTGAIGPTDVTLTVTDSVGTATFDLTITVLHGAAVTVDVIASDTSPKLGATITLTVTATDSAGNSWDATGSAVITSDVPSDIIVGNLVTFTHASPHLLTATVGAASGTVLIQVIAPAKTKVLGYTGGGLASWLLPWGLAALALGFSMRLFGGLRPRRRARH
jgi:uncharacterized repeat protein (TIGR02543 family)